MKKQTAIEWLFAHLLPFLQFSDPKEREHFRKCLAEAKAMEKSQIDNAYIVGVNDSLKSFVCENFYDKTYSVDK
jgi:1,2-phenylacetyl-CoA epoxidase catalytic subunit